MGTIALITDFGTRDWFAGEMKGAMLRIVPSATIVDITHEVAPGDLRMAAFTLRACYATFGPGTVFCVVVDPGVGSERAAIAAKSDRYYFVGPDNGVLSWALAEEKNFAVRRIENTDLTRSRVSATFHGRDIFGPVAAHLSRTGKFDEIGSPFPDFVNTPWPESSWERGRIIGSVVHVDRFGNAITTIEKEAVTSIPSAVVKIARSGSVLPIAAFFQQVQQGQGLGYIGSTGFLEIAINGASAASVYGLAAGDAVEVFAAPDKNTA